MEQFVWDRERFSVGHGLLDAELQQVLEIINRLIQQLKRGEHNPDDVIEVLLELNSYAENHFQNEERLLRQALYPDLQQQKDAHEEYVAQISQFMMQLERGSVSFVHLLEFIHNWWQQHILNDDMAFKPLLQQCS